MKVVFGRRSAQNAVELLREFSGLYDVAHGAGLAANWGSWARYVFHNCCRVPEICRECGVGVDPVGSKEKIALKEIESMEVFFRRIHMLTNLRELGVGGAKDSAMLLPEEDMLAISKASL